MTLVEDQPKSRMTIRVPEDRQRYQTEIMFIRKKNEQADLVHSHNGAVNHGII